MEEMADFELPSPKRMRMVATEMKAGKQHTPPVDDDDDLYGTAQANAETLQDNHRTDSQMHRVVPSAIPQIHMQLPGLGLLEANSTIPSQHGNSEVEESIGSNIARALSENGIAAGMASKGDNVANSKEEDEASAVDNHGLTLEAPNAQEGTPETDFTHKIREDEARPGETVRKDSLRDEQAQSVLQSVASMAESEPKEAISEHSVVQNSHPAAMALKLEPETNGENGKVFSGMDINPTGTGSGQGTFEGLGDSIHPIETAAIARSASEEVAEANKTNGEAEFELDSSPLPSSSDASTDTSSEDSEEEDYKLLSPEEEARRLMAEEGGSDDDGPSKGGKAPGPLRTLNEKPDDVVPKPDISVTEDMKIEELGRVETCVENLALVKAKTSGEYQVLESGSLLCLEDRSVIGVVAETLGRVQQPYYSVRFTNASAIAQAGVQKDTTIFYVEQHSTYVFTQPLKAFKGSDASNIHDEEVGDDEIEFSDDEAEAEHKRMVKVQRQAKKGARDGQSDGFSRGPRGRGRGVPRSRGAMYGDRGGLRPIQERPPDATEASLNYDDGDGMSVDGDELYTPLARPTNLHQMMGRRKPTVENFDQGSTRGGDRGGGRGGRGADRGRGKDRGGRQHQRGGRGSDRGSNFAQRGQPHSHTYLHTNGAQPGPAPLQMNGFPLPPRPPQTNGFHPSPPQPPHHPPTASAPYQAQQYPSYPFQYPDAHIQPTTQSYNQPYQQPIQPQYPQNQSHNHPYPLFFSPPHHHHQQQQQLPPPQTPTPSTPAIPAGAHINPAFFRQQQNQNTSHQQQQYTQHPPPTNVDPQDLANLLRGFGGQQR